MAQGGTGREAGDAVLRQLAHVVTTALPTPTTTAPAPEAPEVLAFGQAEGPFRSEDGQHPAVIVLERLKRTYRMRERISYHEPVPPGRVIVFPEDLERFETDLASVWPIFAWLVPRDGAHTPAVLLHDVLIRAPGEEKNHIGDDVTPDEADRIFGAAMGQLGVEPVRRRLMWAAVSLRTLVDRSARPRARFWWWPVVVATAAACLSVGLSVLADLFDANTPLPSAPGMGDAPWTAEARGWLGAVVVVPLVSLPLWGRWAGVGWVLGFTLTLLAGPAFFATAGIAVYLGVSWTVVGARVLLNRRRPPAERRPVPRPRMLRAPPL